jgi:putative NADH-flavin reductase
VKILVFGATGATGRPIVTAALRRGHDVVGFVRRETDAAKSNSRIIRGDVTESNAVEAAFAERVDVVISALGARSLHKTRLLETGLANIIGAMKRSGVSRLIELSAAGTFGLPNPSRISMPERIVFEILRRTVLRNSFDDHAAADCLIHQSGLDWTIVQPPELSDEAGQGYCIATGGLLRGGAISRADVAAAIIDVMEAGTFVRQSPFVFRK